MHYTIIQVLYSSQMYMSRTRIKNIGYSNDQKSLSDQKMYAKQLGQLFFFSKISNNFTIKLILKFNVFLHIFL